MNCDLLPDMYIMCTQTGQYMTPTLHVILKVNCTGCDTQQMLNKLLVMIAIIMIPSYDLFFFPLQRKMSFTHFFLLSY